MHCVFVVLEEINRHIKKKTKKNKKRIYKLEDLNGLQLWFLKPFQPNSPSNFIFVSL